MFHYRRDVFSSQLKSKVGHILDKTAFLLINMNIDYTSRIHWVTQGTGTLKDRDELRDERFESVKGECVI
jgi:hypothetical protein